MKPLLGDWQHLDNEAPRYQAIADMLKSSGLDDRVLDVGCGTGLLREYLPAKSFYAGIEPCGEAVKLARERPASAIWQADAESFTPLACPYTSIVFNESLYYTADPCGLVRKYINFLHPGGSILVSIWRKPNEQIGWKRKIAHWFDRRRPLGNNHCEDLVLGMQNRERWNLQKCRLVQAQAGAWSIWLARPPAGWRDRV